MEITIRKFSSFQEMKDDEYRYWQSVPASERIAAAWELSIDQYRMKGVEPMVQDLEELLSALNAHKVCYVDRVNMPTHLS